MRTNPVRFFVKGINVGLQQEDNPADIPAKKSRKMFTQLKKLKRSFKKRGLEDEPFHQISLMSLSCPHRDSGSVRVSPSMLDSMTLEWSYAMTLA